MAGATTIRAYNQNARFIRENQEKVELNVQCNYYNYCSNRWLAVRIETLGNVIIFFAALFAILGMYVYANTINAALFVFAM